MALPLPALIAEIAAAAAFGKLTGLAVAVVLVGVSLLWFFRLVTRRGRPG